MTVKVRFAPSPTGKLHVGNVRAALWNWLFARKSGGTFVLRIDDTDRERSTKEYEDGIRADLAWLGLDYDETFSQSARFGNYDAATEKLKAAGLLYPCYETAEELDRKRKIQRAQGQPPVYDRAALKLTDEDKAKLEAEGRQPHWRFKLTHDPVVWTDLVRGDQSIDTASVSDPILIRGDGSYLYTLPSVVDDIEMAITHVVRGEDHVTNSGAQIEIFRALGAEPPSFAQIAGYMLDTLFMDGLYSDLERITRINEMLDSAPPGGDRRGGRGRRGRDGATKPRHQSHIVVSVDGLASQGGSTHNAFNDDMNSNDDSVFQLKDMRSNR